MRCAVYGVILCNYFDLCVLSKLRIYLAECDALEIELHSATLVLLEQDFITGSLPVVTQKSYISCSLSCKLSQEVRKVQRV